MRQDKVQSGSNNNYDCKKDKNSDTGSWVWLYAFSFIVNLLRSYGWSQTFFEFSRRNIDFVDDRYFQSSQCVGHIIGGAIALLFDMSQSKLHNGIKLLW